MRFRYQVNPPNRYEADALPRLPLVLELDGRRVELVALLDSGATVNVLPFPIGLRLGAVWNERDATLDLAGNLGQFTAMPLFVTALIGNFAPVSLAFAWSRSDNVPIILGQINFFTVFDVCFYQSLQEFDINLHDAPR